MLGSGNHEPAQYYAQGDGCDTCMVRGKHFLPSFLLTKYMMIKGGVGNDGTVPQYCLGMTVNVRREALLNSQAESSSSWQEYPHLALKTSMLDPESTNNPHSQNEPRHEDPAALPDIHIHPATPSTPSIQMTFESSPMADSLSLPPRLAAGNQRRRRTLVMGPRSDCEKCRQRLAGHWMHFD